MVRLTNHLHGVQCYLDDLIVYGKTFDEYTSNLYSLLSKLDSVGLKLINKCVFGVQEIEFLGHTIANTGVTPQSEKARAIHDAPIPHDYTSLQSFLGLAGYLSKYCPQYSTTVEPLRTMLRSKSHTKTFESSTEALESFRKINNTIGHHITLSIFDPDLPTIVTCDASDYGIGGVLSQVVNGQEKK
ncbi:hypothetical protein SNE40_001069 [Patella caerulea]|uniref:Reverse transcriptase/retrotransposon-derived protein RNase H-like domain-containing protein n=1 Tax=Patella caerulea TaxID=87958 RepID=A0AAN8KHW8_PATCE